MSSVTKRSIGSVDLNILRLLTLIINCLGLTPPASDRVPGLNFRFWLSYTALQLRNGWAQAHRMEQFMTSTLRNIFIFSSATIGLIACDAVKDAAGDVIEGEPQTSYCEAVCDWAVDCSGEDGALDACLEDTRAEDSSCADAESGDLDPATSKLVEDCVATVETDSCDGLTGSVDAQTTATPSAACVASEGTAAVATYNAARIATQSSGADFCADLGTSICAHVVDCLVGDFELDEATEVLQAACEETAISALISTCNGVDLDPSYGTSPNVNRMMANSCAETVNGLSNSCDIFTLSAWSTDCAAVVVDATALPDIVADLLSFAAGYGVTP